MMSHPSCSIDHLRTLLKRLDGHPFGEYQALLDQTCRHKDFALRLVYIQGSTGAFPASVGHLRVRQSLLRLPDSCLSNRARELATADYLLRTFQEAVVANTRPNRGARGSGSFQLLDLPPQVLERNVVKFYPSEVRITFHVSLPGSGDNRILGTQAARMLIDEAAAIVRALAASTAEGVQLKTHCDVIEDWHFLQTRLPGHDMVAFVGDGAILPRSAGDSQAPLGKGAVAFQAPDQMAVEIEFPNAGLMRGLGIRPGVNVLVGGGFHGKSTLLNAVTKGVYPHIPGDGRERVVTHPQAVFICSEEGRAVNGLDISGFMGSLPGGADPRKFQTRNASGSTSEASAIIEAVLAGARLLLIDEDSSATNFLIKDQNMRLLIPEDPITPLFDRVGELYRTHGVSTLIVVGGSSDYLGAARQVIAMRNYQPESITDRVASLKLPQPVKPAEPLKLVDRRRILPGNFNPAYHARRLGKTVGQRIKPLRLRERVLEYGDAQIDLSKLLALVDPQQVLSLGYALLLAGQKFNDRALSPSALASALDGLVEKEGLEILSGIAKRPVFLARPRQLELAGAINRFRNLRIE